MLCLQCPTMLQCPLRIAEHCAVISSYAYCDMLCLLEWHINDILLSTYYCDMLCLLEWHINDMPTRVAY